MTRVIGNVAINTWRSTCIGYSLEDMTGWWIAAKWYDERRSLTTEELEHYTKECGNTDEPWWTPVARGLYSLTDVLDDQALMFDNYQECKEFCDDPKNSEFMPLNVGDYIRWEDDQIDGHRLRKLADPIYKASQRFFATKPKAS